MRTPVVVKTLHPRGRASARLGRRRLCLISAFAAIPLLLAGCGDDPSASATPIGIKGNTQNGRQLIKDFGCGSCHQIPGIDNADSMVGPPLVSWRRRIYIAGVLRNTPDNLQLWIQHPQQIVPNNAMPEMGISARQAQDIAAYLYTLK
jgi:cytochrome c2